MILDAEKIALISNAAVKHNRWDVFPLLASHREQAEQIVRMEVEIKRLNAFVEAISGADEYPEYLAQTTVESFLNPDLQADKTVVG